MVAIPRRIKRASRLAYEGLVSSGQLKGKGKHILAVMVANGPATSGEVINQFGGVTNVNAWRGRFSELQARGLIRQIGERQCKISGRLCIVWAPTGRDTALDEGRKHVATSPAAEWRSRSGEWCAMADRMAQLLEAALPDLDTGSESSDMRAVEIGNALTSYRALAKQERTRERRRRRS